MTLPFRKPLFVPVFLSLVTGTALPGKEKTDIPSPPPMAKPAQVAGYVGEPVEIELKIAGRIVEPLKFLIRRPPQRGSLTAPRRMDRNTALVTYTPDPLAGPGGDAFTFAAQSADSPVSAAATVWIRTALRPADLSFPSLLSFGSVFLGDTAAKELVLDNSGGIPATGELRVNAPWEVDGSRRFSVPGGMQIGVRIVFCPTEEREYRDRIRIADDPPKYLELRGSGVAPVVWPTDGLLFTPELRQKGTAAITLRNQTDREREVVVVWPAGLRGTESLRLPPSGSQEVSVSVVDPVPQVIRSEAVVCSGNYEGKMPVVVYPMAATFEVKPGNALHLGAVRVGRQAEGRLTVKNTGEVASPIKLQVPDGVSILPDVSAQVLEPGSELELRFSFTPLKAGEFSETIRIGAGSGEPVAVQIKADVRESGPLPVGEFLQVPKVVPETPAPVIPLGGVPPVGAIWLLSAAPHEIKLGWDLTSPETSGYRIERRQLRRLPDGSTAVEWVEFTGVKVTIADGKVTAHFSRLAENNLWTIRITGLDAMGKEGAPSPAFQMATTQSKRLELSPWFLLPVFVVMAAVAGWLARRRRQALLAREDEKLARLESE